MGVGPIPWSAIMRWADRRCYDDDEAALFERAVKAMDTIWLADQSEKNKQGAGTPTKPTISKRKGTMKLFDAMFT